MKSMKLMCSGIFLIAVAAWCAALMDSNVLALALGAFFLPIPGAILFLLGLIRGEDF